ncbi:GGDEF domain-containing protein [Amantichitinum ursilacus]|uniref:diguanylate cyclase n=1 Tax=Amantichitinum ursilacus TaxID=857265 RepID=A0A0N0XML7_9NEIS|nr:sensor domain-containing diguanylate cyclase [Amantichitinum ursilacus]KPC54807.1 putative diguanylate cyclase YdaM [Amantichitinum ursilacus]
MQSILSRRGALLRLRRTFQKNPQLAVIVMLCVVLGASTGHSVYRDYQETVRQQRAIVRDLSRVAAAHARNTLQEADNALQQTLGLVSAAGGIDQINSLDYWWRIKSYAFNVGDCQGVWIFDRSGKPVLESSTFPAPANVNSSDRDFFKAALAGQRFYVSTAFKSRVSGKLVYGVSRPIHARDGHIEGVALVALRIDNLNDFYALMSFDSRFIFGIYSNDGRIVARTPDMDAVLGRSVKDEALYQDRDGQSGMYDLPSPLDHVQRITGWQRVPEFGVIGYAALSHDLALRPWRVRTLTTALEAAITLAVLVAAVLWGFRATVRESQAQRLLREAALNQVRIIDELETAQQDALTGLYGRKLMMEQAERKRQQAAERNDCLVFMLLDLDGFKAVNDQYGHDTGDQVLIATAAALRACLRPDDLAGRWGGDEFVVAVSVSPHTARAQVDAIARRIVQRVGEIGYGISGSLGIAIFDAHISIDLATRRADAAMYEAKHRGKNGFVIWDESIGLVAAA